MNAQRILIFEDEPGILSTIEIALSADGFIPVSAMTADAGMALLNQDISLVILDVGLPDRNGFEVLKEIRRTLNTPVILLTARNSEIDKVLGLELGADDFVVKPFSPRELVARIKAIVRRTYVPPKDVKSPLILDIEKKVIFFHNTALTLTPYEFKTLALFIKNPGRIFTREEIMDIVWTEPEDSFDRAVDTVIKNIRNRIKEIDKDSDLIETRRSQGYGLKDKK